MLEKVRFPAFLLFIVAMQQERLSLCLIMKAYVFTPIQDIKNCSNTAKLIGTQSALGPR